MKTRSLPLLAALGLLMTAIPLHAQVFKCKGPNGVVYQDGPCEGGAVIDARSSSGGVNPAGSGKSEGGSPAAVTTKPTHPVVPERMRR
jgi:hypothetical protein